MYKESPLGDHPVIIFIFQFGNAGCLSVNHLLYVERFFFDFFSKRYLSIGLKNKLHEGCFIIYYLLKKRFGSKNKLIYLKITYLFIFVCLVINIYKKSRFVHKLLSQE